MSENSVKLNFKLHPSQMKIYKDPHRFKVVVAGRRFGKSWLAVVMCLIEGLKQKHNGRDLSNSRVFYVAPTFDQAKRNVWNLFKILGKDIIKKTTEHQGIITLVNDRIIELKGSDNPDSLRGVGLSFCVMDEYADMKPEVWELIIRPALADVKGGALFIGTPKGKNHFYELVNLYKDDPDWAMYSFTSFDNPFLDRNEVEAMSRQMTSSGFRQEIEAKFVSGGTGVFKEEWIQYSSQEPKDGYYYITLDPAGFVDLAKGTKTRVSLLDETAIAVVKVDLNGHWWVKTIDYGKWPIKEVVERVLAHAIQTKAVAIGIEKGALENAIRPYLEDYMKNINHFFPLYSLTHGQKKKSDRIAWALQGRMQHGKITLNRGPWNKKFVEQLLDFPDPRAHDDLIDALSYVDQLAQTAVVGNKIQTLSNNAADWVPLDDVAGY